MRKFMKEHDIWLRLLSLVLAVVLWAIVMDIENPEKPKTINDIPITIVGQKTLFEKTGLSVIEGAEETISIRIKGKNADIASITSAHIGATVDVSDITAAGQYDLDIKVTQPRSNVSIESVRPLKAGIRIDKITTAEIPVHADTTGTPANGYRAGEPKVLTNKVITIEGPEAELSEVRHAYVVIDATGATNTVEEDCPITLCNAAGDPITSSHVTSKTKTIRVTLPIYQNGSVQLSVLLKDGVDVTSEMAQVSIDPEMVQLYGDQNVIKNLTKIELGEIDLNNVKTGEAISMPIKLPDGVHLAEGQRSTAHVTITIDGMTTEERTVTNIAVENTANITEGVAVELLSESVKVQVRGSESKLKKVTGDNFVVRAQIDSTERGNGTHLITAHVTSTNLPDGVALIDDSVELSITISGVEEGTAEIPPETEEENPEA